jgi:hypothetical protein
LRWSRRLQTGALLVMLFAPVFTLLLEPDWPHQVMPVYLIALLVLAVGQVVRKRATQYLLQNE